MLVELILAWLLAQHLPKRLAEPTAVGLSLASLVVCAWLINFATKRFILHLVAALIGKTKFEWDDIFLKAGVFSRLSHVAPVLVVTLLGPEFFLNREDWAKRLETGVSVYLVVIVVMVGFALLDAVVEVFRRNEATKALPIKGFVQSAKLVVFLMSTILVLSVLMGRSPVYFLSGLGALTAVLLLVFKDALLGLVAGVQISANRMVQIGDWIEMPKYGADGDVIDIGLTTVKVRNWDKTITTVPTYALISDPVKNWRGMSEIGGRRIKRSISLDMQTFRFVDQELLDKLLTFRRLRGHLQRKLAEIDEHNRNHNEDLKALANGRRLTNVGCFRAYVTEYLKEHPQIRQDMTFLVRQLQPTSTGLPLEIYVFSADTRWAYYEGIQADIFDHLLTVLPEFGLRVYQSPSSLDVSRLGEALSASSKHLGDR